MRLIMNDLTVNSDEMEGTQTISLDSIHGCSTDYIEYTEPSMTLDEISEMLHLKDKNTGEGDDGTGDKSIKGKPYTGDNGDDKDRTPKIPDWSDFGDIDVPKDKTYDDIASDIINDDKIGSVNAIIEFAQPSIRDERGVDYSISVKPGQSVRPETIIGSAIINNEKKAIRSIFGSGTVWGTPDGKQFKHLYESAGANRHIVIRNCTIAGEAPELTPELIENIQHEFSQEAELFDLITNNICESVLPWILGRRYTQWIFMAPGVRLERKNGREIFREYMDYVNDIRERYANDIKEMNSEDTIRSLNGNRRKIDALGYRILERRKRYAEEIITAYLEYKETLDKVEYDPAFEDCRYLAYVHEIGYHTNETSTRVGDLDYFNYYTALLSMLSTYTDNKYVKRYNEILKEIIEERIAAEGYSPDVIRGEFNELYKKIIDFRVKNGFQRIDAEMNTIASEGRDIDPQTVASWITQHLAVKKDEYTDMSIRQLANMYIFIRNYKAFNGVPGMRRVQLESHNDEIDEASLMIYNLTMKENEKLMEFWDEVLGVWANTSIFSSIEKTTTEMKKINNFAEWPLPSELIIDGQTFHHYLFENDVHRQRDDEDEDMGNVIIDTIPPDPSTFQPEDVTNEEAIPLNDENIEVDEISIRDIAYWRRYFSLATVISLPYLACGLDIPPAEIMLIPLPCIFIAIDCVYIKALDLVLVAGISIRGMYVWPVFLYVNGSTQWSSILSPLISQLKTVQSKISAKINALAEMPINALADNYIMKFEDEARKLRQENKLLENYITSIEARKVANQETIKKHMSQLKDKFAKTTQHVIDPLGEEKDAKRKSGEKDNK